MFNFLVAEVTPVAFTDIGWRYFIVYCALNAAWVPIVFLFFPETAGRSLEEIDEIFAQSKSIWDPVKVAKSLPKRHLVDVVEKHPETKPETSHVEHSEKDAQTPPDADPFGSDV